MYSNFKKYLNTGYFLPFLNNVIECNKIDEFLKSHLSQIFKRCVGGKQLVKVIVRGLFL